MRRARYLVLFASGMFLWGLALFLHRFSDVLGGLLGYGLRFIPAVVGLAVLFGGLWYVLRMLGHDSRALSHGRGIAAVGGWFLAATAVMLYPATRTLNIHPIGSGGDAWFFLWEFWWVKKSILGPAELFFSDYIFYPSGADLRLNTFSFFNSGIAFVLQFLTDNLVLVYNVLILFSFVATGIATYLLVTELTDDRRLGLLAGIVFTFAPFRMARALGHLNLLSVQFLPVFVLFLVRSIREDGYRNPIVAAAFFVLLTLSSYFYALFAALFGGLLVLYLLQRQCRGHASHLDAGTWTRLVVMGVAIIAVLTPLLLPVLQGSMGYESRQSMAGASLEAYVRPTARLSLYERLPRLTLDTLAIESSLFLGYTVIAFAGIAVFRRFPWKWFWFGSAGVFFLLSTGAPPGIENLPVIGLMERPARFGVMVLFSLLVPFSHGVAHLADRLRERDPRSLVYMAVALLVLVEFAWVPYPHGPDFVDSSTRDFYEDLAGMPEGAVLDIPLDSEEGHRQNMYLQTIHTHPIVGGRPSRLLDQRPDGYPRILLDGLRRNEYRPVLSGMAAFEKMLRANGIRYVIFHRTYSVEARPPEWLVVSQFDRRFSRVFENTEIVAYQVY